MLPEQPGLMKEPPKTPGFFNKNFYIGLGIGLGSALIIAGLAFAAYTLFVAPNYHDGKKIKDNQDQDNTLVNVTGDNSANNSNGLGSYTQDAYGNKEFSIKDGQIKVNWLKKALPVDKTQASELISPLNGPMEKWCRDEIDNMVSMDGNGPVDYEAKKKEGACDVYAYQAGTFEAPQALAGRTLYDLYFPSNFPGGQDYVHYFGFKESDTFIFVLAPQGETEGELLISGPGVGIIRHTFNELVPPQSLALMGDTNGSKLVFEGMLTDGINVKGALDNRGDFGEVLNPKDKTYSAPLSGLNPSFVDPKIGPVYFKDNLYKIEMLNGAIAIYELKPYFLSSDGAPVKIKWDKENAGADTYEQWGEIGGWHCSQGLELGTNIVNKESWFNEKKLVKIGQTEKGEMVYELSDKSTNPFYKSVFDYGFYSAAQSSGWNIDGMTDKEKMDKFLNDRPLFFWKDLNGNWRVYKKTQYMSAVECGKPVIYLYPEKDTDVQVKVEPNGGFSKTEPTYEKNGWMVHTTPDSQIFNFSDKKTYPYLFWEGKAYNMQTPTAGFVLKRSEVKEKMPKILAKLGLNEKEIRDFLDFWQSELEVKPYVFVTFVPQSEFDQVAPLTVWPRPDKIIRVFMDYQPLDKPFTVRPLYIQTPERSGFTVVEWGGRLLNNF